MQVKRRYASTIYPYTESTSLGAKPTISGGRLLQSSLAALALVGVSLPAWPDWSQVPYEKSIHEPYVYAPSSTLPGGKRGLLVILHGCFQHAVELKGHGNLKDEAEKRGMVIVLPAVGLGNDWAAGCWDYDQAKDGHQHMAKIRKLTEDLRDREDLAIDKDHVYVAGLSSGGALALAMGCAAPDLFAGVAAIAGPSVGSEQRRAASTAQRNLQVSSLNLGIPKGAAKKAFKECLRLAWPHRDEFKTQIANIGHGEQDREGANNPKYDYNPLWNAHPGQYQVVSVRWARHNRDALRQIYQITDPRTKVSTLLCEGEPQHPCATETSYRVNGQIRLSELSMPEVGHAWPAGKRENGFGGAWIFQSGFNYSGYIMDWFLEHNVRSKKASGGNP